MIVADLAIVNGIETHAEAAGEVHFLAELRRGTTITPEVRVQPREADAITLIGYLSNTQVEIDFRRTRKHPGARIGKPNRVDARHAAR